MIKYGCFFWLKKYIVKLNMVLFSLFLQFFKGLRHRKRVTLSQVFFSIGSPQTRVTRLRVCYCINKYTQYNFVLKALELFINISDLDILKTWYFSSRRQQDVRDFVGKNRVCSEGFWRLKHLAADKRKYWSRGHEREENFKWPLKKC